MARTASWLPQTRHVWQQQRPLLQRCSPLRLTSCHWLARRVRRSHWLHPRTRRCRWPTRRSKTLP